MFAKRQAYPVVSFRAGALYTAAQDGHATVDLQNYEEALVIVTAHTITDGGFVFELKESDDNSSFTAVADADLAYGGPAATDLEPTFAATDDNHTHWFYYKGAKRYLRIDLKTVTGTPSTGGSFTGTVVKMSPRHSPSV